MTPRTPFLFKRADRKIQRQMPEPSAEEEQETVCGVCVWLLFFVLNGNIIGFHEWQNANQKSNRIVQ
jgi:hypothetical protein